MRFKNSTSDQELIHAYVGGDESAFNFFAQKTPV